MLHSPMLRLPCSVGGTANPAYEGPTPSTFQTDLKERGSAASAGRENRESSPGADDGDLSQGLPSSGFAWGKHLVYLVLP